MTTNLAKEGKVKVTLNLLKRYCKKTTNPEIKDFLGSIIDYLTKLKVKDKFYFTILTSSYNLLKTEIPEKYLVDNKKVAHRYSDSSWVILNNMVVYTNCEDQTASY